eukprot:7853766-Pyramimonas_sp.AAC.1
MQKDAQLVVSDKTVAVASSAATSTEIARGLQRQGTPARAVMTAVDLGCDVGAGLSRVRLKARDGRKKAAMRTKAIAKVRRIARRRRVSQGLWRTG